MLVGMLALVSAFYPGETIIFENEMGIENLVYAIIGNSSAVNLIVEVDTDNITITFPQDMTPDSFDIVFLEEQIAVQTITVSSGGGSSSTKYVYKNVTEYVEVDNYIDREVIVEGETIVKEVEAPSKPNYAGLIVIFLLIIALTFTSWWAVRSSRKDE